MGRTWQLQEAKSRLSELVDEALWHGPQVITRRGLEAVVVLSFAEYTKMKKVQKKLSVFFRESPLADAQSPQPEMDLERDRSAARNDVVL